MASYSPKLSEKKYNNWIKAQLAVLFTKEGVEPFVCNEMQQFQLKCLNDICYLNGLFSGTCCSSCCTENVVHCRTDKICNVNHGKCSYHRNVATRYNSAGCPNKICHKFKTEIQNAHRYNGPSYKNSDATQWCSNFWEVAKCFMPPDGYKEKASASETDFNGIISVILNHKNFQGKVHENLNNMKNIFEKARVIGRNMRHSPTLEIEDSELQNYFQILQQLLSDPVYLGTDTHAQDAKQKLIQLENDTLVIGKDDIRKVLDDVATAIQDKMKAGLDEKYDKIKLDMIRRKQEDLLSLESKTAKGMTQIQNKTDASVKSLNDERDKELDTIHKQGNKERTGLAELGETLQKELKTANKAEKEEQYLSLESKTVEGMTQIQDKTDASVKRLNDERNKEVDTIHKLGEKERTDLAELGETLQKELKTASKAEKEEQYIDSKQHICGERTNKMASVPNPTLSKPKFLNWVKAVLAVLFTKDEIEPVVVDEMVQFQQKCLQDISISNGLSAGSTCSNCKTENIVVCPTNKICNVNRGQCGYHRNHATQFHSSGCPNKICHNVRSEIQKAHRFYGPSFKNTDATQWCSNPWEIAKCFMPPDGYKDVMSAVDTDFNGIISVIVNFNGFETKINNDLSRRNNIFDKGRNVGKAVRHSPKLEVEDADLTQYFTILNDMLTDPGFIALNKAPNNAIQNLAKLQMDELIIGKDVVRAVLEDVGNAIREQIRNEMDEYKQKTEKQKLELIEIINLKVKDIDDKENCSLSKLNDAFTSSIDAFEAKVQESIQEIRKQKTKGKRKIKIVAKEGANVIKEIQTAAEKPRDTDADAKMSEETYQKRKEGLTDYLKMFYSKSESFNTFCQELEELRGFSLRIGPTFEKIDITSQDVKEMNQNEALIEILQIPYTLEGIQCLKPVLVLGKDTTTSANFIVSAWLNHVENNNYPMNLNSLDGVFLLKIADSDDVTDLNIMLEERFQMKKSYYSQRILIIFECIHTDHFKLKQIYHLACSCMFQACKFIIITKIEKQVVLGLKLDMQFILIADKIDALHVARTQFEEGIDGQKLGKRIDQIVSKRKCVSCQKDAITKICFENIHPLNETKTVRVPKDINNIELHGCSHKIQVLHCAKHLDISVSNRFSNILPEQIVTPTLTTVAIYFKSLEHVFYKSVYESFAFNISRATHILSLRLCNMTFGRKSITVELQKEGIEQIRHSIESNEDYCRFGARILGPCLGKISFDKEDVESENNSSFVKQIMLDLICYELVKSNRTVSECYPSQMECGTIKLICFVNDDVRIDSFKGFLLVKKDCNNISKESLFAENSCDNEKNNSSNISKESLFAENSCDNEKNNSVVNATVEEFEDINETLSFHAEALMASHRNLEAVKVSFVQPKDMTLVQSKLCIVLYCRAKGCIPYGDVRFPRTLIHPFKNKSFRTDVREGYFIACPYRTGHSTDFNKELAIGCSIGQYEQKPAATLGPFVNIEETNETCFLTVRHVFGQPSIKEDCLVGVKVVQPADYHLSPDDDKLQNRHCGEVLVSHIGGQIDAALVKISAERLPGRGQFIRLTREDLDWTGLTEQPMFNDGAFMDAKTLTVKDLATRRIIKIGCTTSLTKGTLSTTAGIVRETLEYTSLETLYNGSKEKYRIKSQLMVDSYYKKVFCQAGDSGSAVFLVEDDNHLNCIGMVIGFIYNDHTAIVTPIDNILKILGHKLKQTLKLKKFRETDEMDES